MDFESIYTTYFNDVYLYIRRLSNNEHIAEEITSECFFKAMQIRRQLHDIPDPYKEVFMWRTFAELNFKQIGQIFGKTDNWACVTYHRARNMIKIDWRDITMKGNCNIVRDILPLYVEDMASVDTVLLVEEHLASCEECRAELEGMKSPKELENKSENIEAKHAIKTIREKWYWKIGVLALYYIPVIVALAFYGTLALVAGLGVIQTSAWFLVGFLVLAAILMTKNKWWGCLCGIVVGITLIYMSTQYTGQVIDIERPLGIIFCVYYIICGFLTYKQAK